MSNTDGTYLNNGGTPAWGTRRGPVVPYVPALDGFRSLYVDWDGQEKISTPNVIQNLFPLLLPVLPQNFVAKLVEEVLKKKVPCSHLIFIRFTGSQQQQIQQYLCSSHCSAG